MLNKKLYYREDESKFSRMKAENDVSVPHYEPFEDAKSDLPARGRQLATKTVTISKKDNSSKMSQYHPNSTKNSISSRVLIQYQSKGKVINSKGGKTDAYHVEEEYESSDSDLSLKNQKKREILYDSVDLPDNLIYKAEVESLENSQELENYEVSDDLLYNHEDNLTNEIERILIDIYNNHISFNSKKKLDISKYEKHIKIFSKTLNKQYNIFILQILSEKIKELINRYKEKIFEIPEIKQIRDRYYEIKANLEASRREEEETGVKNPVNSRVSISQSRKNSNLTATSSPIRITQDNLSKNAKKEFNEADKSVTKILLLELRNIKKSLIESSKDIEKVFKWPLSQLKLNKKVVRFSIEEMHREEFTKTLIQDEFISALIAQIKEIARQLRIDEINQLIFQIEEDLYSKKKEMTRFTEFLITQLRSFIESELEDEEEESLNEAGNSSDRSGVNGGSPHVFEVKSLSLNSLSKNYTTNSTSNDNSSSPKNKIAHDIGIDELVEYIEKTDDCKIKKNKKKLKKKKNKKETASQIENDIKDTEEFDREIDNFKKLIAENSKSAICTKKIRPLFTKEWLSTIANLVNAKN